MTENTTPLFEVSDVRKKHADEVRTRALILGIKIIQPGDNVPLGSNAIYIHHPDCDLNAIAQELAICGQYARSFDLSPTVAFTDWHRSLPEFKRMLEFANRGRIASVIFNDVQVFKFCIARQIGTFLAPLRDTGVDFHFAAQSATNKLLKLPLSLGKAPQSNRQCEN